MRPDENEKPRSLPVVPQNIPAELQEGRRFVLWRYILRDGRWTKPPFQPNGRNADSTDPETWVTFAEVVAAYQAGGWDGIGRVHLPDDRLVGVDVDHCLDAEKAIITSAFVGKAIRLLDTYTEISPSGTGLRAFCRGIKPGRRCKKNDFELYDGLTAAGEPGGRYLTLTGQHWRSTPATVHDRQAEIDQVYNNLFGPAEAEAPEPAPERVADWPPVLIATSSDPVHLSDDEVLRRAYNARKGEAFRQLWTGNKNGYGDDDSSADLALCNRLRWWTGGDRAQVDRLFRRSGLMRPKWDEMRGQKTYGQMTLDVAMIGNVRQPRTEKDRRSQPGPSGDVPPERPPEATAETLKKGSDSSSRTESAADAQVLRMGKDVILEHLRQRLEPVFRRGGEVYSHTLRRSVRRTDSAVAMSTELFFKLLNATDVPRDKEKRPLTNNIPGFFGTWLPTVWSDLLASLPEEEGAGEIVDTAQEEFREKVAAGLHTIVSHGKHFENGKETETQARSIIDWCVLWAQTGRWMKVRSWLVWIKKVSPAPPGDPAFGLRVAIRSGLFRQTRSPDLATLTQRKFDMLAALYDVGEPCRAGGTRNTELCPGFIASLLDASNADASNADRPASKLPKGDLDNPKSDDSDHSKGDQSGDEE